MTTKKKPAVPKKKTPTPEPAIEKSVAVEELLLCRGLLSVLHEDQDPEENRLADTSHLGQGALMVRERFRHYRDQIRWYKDKA